MITSESKKEYNRNYYLKNKKKINQVNKRNYEAHKDVIAYKQRLYVKNNKDSINAYKRGHYAENPHYYRLRTVLRNFLKRKNLGKEDSYFKIIGYSLKQFEEKFPIIFSGYHIDHKIPVSWFVDTVPVQIANSLENLQLIKGLDNLCKNNIRCDKVSKEYFEQCLPYIKNEYTQQVIYAHI
jgi:hypothetical protein